VNARDTFSKQPGRISAARQDMASCVTLAGHAHDHAARAMLIIMMIVLAPIGA